MDCESEEAFPLRLKSRVISGGSSAICRNVPTTSLPNQ